MKFQLKYAVVTIFILAYATSVFAQENPFGAVTTTAINEENKEFQYSVHIQYPQLIDLPSEESQKKINNEIKRLIQKKVRMFKKDAAEFFADARGDEDVGSLQDIGYSEYRAGENGRLLSLLISEDRYLISTAHPAGVDYVARSYDLKTYKRITLPMLFKRKSAYLKKLSEYATKDIVKQFGEDADTMFFSEGAAPRYKNFKSFALSPDGLIIFFPTYHVAPYVAGPQQVTIPYEELKNIIDPKGPLRYVLTSLENFNSKQKAIAEYFFINIRSSDILPAPVKNKAIFETSKANNLALPVVSRSELIK